MFSVIYRSVTCTIDRMYRRQNHVRHSSWAAGVKPDTSLKKYARGVALYIQEFFQDTTIQGLRYIVAPNQHPLEM